MTRGRPGSIPYGGGTLEVPSGPFRLDEVRGPAPNGASVLDAAGIAAAFDAPIDAPPVRDVFRGARTVLVAVSDATRKTGAHRFLPELVERIRSACDAEIEFIVGSGIHRAPTSDEIRSILGPELASSHATLIHDPDDDGSLVELGRTGAGTRVRVHAAVPGHDRVVLTGGVGFHYYAGFSGGRKSVVPGLAGRETVTRNHLRALRDDGTRDPGATAARLAGNPVHRDMEEGAAMVGADLLVNSIVNEAGEPERLYVGHWRTAHERACRDLADARKIVLEPRDLVVASAGGSPSDINLIQSHKAFEAGARVLRPGGVFILAASCPEGAGHDDFLPWFRYDREEDLIRELRADFKVYGQTALSWFRKARDFRLVLVSDLDDGLAREIGAEPAADLEVAFERAARYIPAGTPGWLLTQGTRFLPEPANERTA